MKIKLKKGTNRNTQAHIVSLNDHTMFFSYETCIGYDGPLGQFRLDNLWGPTTGRHINEMGLRNYPVISQQEMENILSSI